MVIVFTKCALIFFHIRPLKIDFVVALFYVSSCGVTTCTLGYHASQLLVHYIILMWCLLGVLEAHWGLVGTKRLAKKIVLVVKKETSYNTCDLLLFVI